MFKHFSNQNSDLKYINKMLEAVVQKLIDKYLGKYIEGLDRENLKLGVMKGDFIVEKVKLQENISSVLDLPFRIVFSYIGKLSAKIPYSKISSQPIEVLLHDVYLIVEPLGEEDPSEFI